MLLIWHIPLSKIFKMISEIFFFLCNIRDTCTILLYLLPGYIHDTREIFLDRKIYRLIQFIYFSRKKRLPNTKSSPLRTLNLLKHFLKFIHRPSHPSNHPSSPFPLKLFLQRETPRVNELTWTANGVKR